MLKKVSKKNLSPHLKILSADWKINDTSTQLNLTKKFDSFLKAFMFVTRVSINAEVLAIYPEITLNQNNVKITINNNGPLTKADYALAQRVDLIALSTTK